MSFDDDPMTHSNINFAEPIIRIAYKDSKLLVVRYRQKVQNHQIKHQEFETTHDAYFEKFERSSIGKNTARLNF